MTDRVTWDEVGRRFTELGRTLKAHAPGPAATGGATGAATTGADAADTSATADDATRGAGTGSAGVDDALAKVTDALNRLSATVSDAVDDPDVRDAARTAMHGVGAALSLTFDEIAEAINRAAGTTDRGAPSSPPPGPADATPTAEADTPVDTEGDAPPAG